MGWVGCLVGVGEVRCGGKGVIGRGYSGLGLVKKAEKMVGFWWDFFSVTKMNHLS